MSSKLDDYILSLGQPGKKQVIGASILVFSFMQSIGLNYILSFITMSPEHHCRLPLNSTWSKNMSIPNQVLASGAIVYDKCQMFVDPANHSAGLKKCEFGYEYLPSDVMRHTIVSEWDMVCENKYLVRVFQTIFFVGIMIGGAFCGYLADLYGRKKVWMIACVLQAVAEIPMRFIYSFEWYCVIAFLRGMFIQGQTTAAYSALMEMFPGRFRTFASVVTLACPSLSVGFGTAICYFLTYWRNQMLLHAMTTIISIIGFYFVEENIRWLVVSQRIKQAHKVSKSFASFNGIPLSKDNENYIAELAEDVKRSMEASSKKKQTIADLMRHSYLRKIMLIICASMFVAQICVYGFNFLIPELGGNVYVNFVVLSCAEFVVRMSAYYGVEKIGRRLCTCFTLLITGSMNILFLILKIYKDAHPSLGFFIIAVGLIGRIFNGVYFITSLIQATEILPTTVRSTASGAIVATGRLGLLILPGVLLLGDYVWTQLPFLLFGILGISVGFLTLLLPETKGRVLPDTIDDAQSFSKSKIAKRTPVEPEEAKNLDVGQPMLGNIA